MVPHRAVGGTCTLLCTDFMLQRRLSPSPWILALSHGTFKRPVLTSSYRGGSLAAMDPSPVLWCIQKALTPAGSPSQSSYLIPHLCLVSDALYPQASPGPAILEKNLTNQTPSHTPSSLCPVWSESLTLCSVRSLSPATSFLAKFSYCYPPISSPSVCAENTA